jgi:VanZ family protein
MISFLLSVRQSVRIILIITYVGCIMALSLLPPQDFPKLPLFEGVDKVVHFLMYFIFSFLFCWSIKTELNYRRLFIVIISTIGWGIFMEIMQLSMHLGRSFSWYDILANSFGVLVGIIVYILSIRNSRLISR